MLETACAGHALERQRRLPVLGRADGGGALAVYENPLIGVEQQRAASWWKVLNKPAAVPAGPADRPTSPLLKEFRVQSCGPTLSRRSPAPSDKSPAEACPPGAGFPRIAPWLWRPTPWRPRKRTSASGDLWHRRLPASPGAPAASLFAAPGFPFRGCAGKERAAAGGRATLCRSRAPGRREQRPDHGGSRRAAPPAQRGGRRRGALYCLAEATADDADPVLLGHALPLLEAYGFPDEAARLSRRTAAAAGPVASVLRSARS